MSNRASAWNLIHFDRRMDEWIAREAPDEDRRFAVGHWILGVMDDPYPGMRRQAGFDNLWFGAVPGTRRSDDTAVACGYWVVERTRSVRCESFATLGLPL
ncbi:MAG: hypothetical protein ACT4QG_03230 [Sporichthyaceae bacterium]